MDAATMVPLFIQSYNAGTTLEQTSQEARRFFAQYTSWQEWIYRRRDRPCLLRLDMATLTFFMTWLEAFLQGDQRHSVSRSWLALRSREYGVSACLMWIWMHAETIPEEKLEQVLITAAGVFHENMGHSDTFQPQMLMEQAGDLRCAADRILLEFMLTGF